MTNNKSNHLTAKKVAKLSRKLSASHDQAIREYAKQDFERSMIEGNSSEYPEGLGSEMDEFLDHLKTEWLKSQKNAKIWEDRKSKEPLLSYKESSDVIDPFEEDNFSEFSWDEVPLDTDLVPEEEPIPMKLAAKSATESFDPQALDTHINVDGKLVQLWQCNARLFVRFQDLADSDAISIRGKRFFLSAYPRDPKFAEIVGLSPKVIRRWLSINER